jgi:hypothetical protein
MPGQTSVKSRWLVNKLDGYLLSLSLSLSYYERMVISSWYSTSY